MQGGYPLRVPSRSFLSASVREKTSAPLVHSRVGVSLASAPSDLGELLVVLGFPVNRDQELRRLDCTFCRKAHWVLAGQIVWR